MCSVLLLVIMDDTVINRLGEGLLCCNVSVSNRLHYATKNWSWFLLADFMIDSEYFFITEPESAVQISVRACVRELFAIRGFFRDFPRNVVF